MEQFLSLGKNPYCSGSNIWGKKVHTKEIFASSMSLCCTCRQARQLKLVSPDMRHGMPHGLRHGMRHGIRHGMHRCMRHDMLHGMRHGMYQGMPCIEFNVRCLMLCDDQCSITLWIPKEKGMHPGMRLSMHQDMHEGMRQGMRQGMCQGMDQLK